MSTLSAKCNEYIERLKVSVNVARPLTTEVFEFLKCIIPNKNLPLESLTELSIDEQDCTARIVAILYDEKLVDIMRSEKGDLVVNPNKATKKIYNALENMIGKGQGLLSSFYSDDII